MLVEAQDEKIYEIHIEYNTYIRRYYVDNIFFIFFEFAFFLKATILYSFSHFYH